MIGEVMASVSIYCLSTRYFAVEFNILGKRPLASLIKTHYTSYTYGCHHFANHGFYPFKWCLLVLFSSFSFCFILYRYMWCLFYEKFEDARVIIRSGNSKNDNRMTIEKQWSKCSWWIGSNIINSSKSKSTCRRTLVSRYQFSMYPIKDIGIV
jgi:hypothetical protein